MSQRIILCDIFRSPEMWNNTYVPLKNAEFWYVNSARLDGGIPEKLNSGKTTSEGTFTIKKGDIIALFPGVAGTEYRITETESGENWICETDTLTDKLLSGGASRSITNYYKWKDLLLTKNITHQKKEDYDLDPQAFTFCISEVEKKEDGTEKLTPVTGKKWVLLDEDGNEIAGAVDESTSEVEAVDGEISESENDSETAATRGVLDNNGEFTCNMGFRTVKIKGLEAGKTYRIVELTDGIEKEGEQPLYIPVGDGEATTTMPVYSTRRNVTITNDYQKRPLSVTKTVVKSSFGSDEVSDIPDMLFMSLDQGLTNLGQGDLDSVDDMLEPDDTVFYRFTASVNGNVLTKGTNYTVTKADGQKEIRQVGVSCVENPVFANADEQGSELGEDQFMLADGETATFEYVGMIGEDVIVTEIDNNIQVYPAKKEPYRDTLSGDGAEASFVNGEPGSLLLRKEYVGIDDVGKKAAEELNTGHPWNFAPNMDDINSERLPGSVDFILEITDEEGTYVWPESTVTIKTIVIEGERTFEQDRVIEKGDSITVAPGETLIIPTGDGTGIPADATYTLKETEESKNQVRLYNMVDIDSFETEEYYLQISQSAASDALGRPESVSGRPSAVIYNEISAINKSEDGSMIGKQMTLNSEDVPNGKKLVWRVERYDAERGEWYPAEGIPYVVSIGGWIASQQVEYTKGDGLHCLVMNLGTRKYGSRKIRCI